MFMEELWGLLVDAQNSIGGIPSAFIQDKKDEILQAKVRSAGRVFFDMDFSSLGLNMPGQVKSN